MQQNIQKQLKTINKIYNPKKQLEGEGIEIMRVIGGQDVKTLDPFLMLDYINEKQSTGKGAPDHPHRGFQTVSYIKKGNLLHEDFLGNKGELNEGDIQWMTAGKGIVHSEIPKQKNQEVQAFQLWINLKKENKYCNPHYQEIKSQNIPIVKKDNVSVKLIAGEAFGEKGPIVAETPTYYMDIKMGPNSTYIQKIPKQWNCILFIFQGTATFNGQKNQIAKEEQAVLFNKEDNEFLNIQSGDQGLDFMLMAGEPINEPIAWHGPFVLNEQEELYQAFEDYQKCKNGFEHRKNWESKIQYLHQN